MTYTYFIGLDVGKDSFEAALFGSSQTQSFSNDKLGFAAFREAYAEQLSQAFVVVEATGGYEAALIAELLSDHVSVHRATPLQAKHFARSLKLRGKTDSLDALALARYGAERHDSLNVYSLPDATVSKLRDCSERRADLIAMQTAEKTRRQHPRCQNMLASIDKVMQVLAEEIAALEKTIAETIDASEEMSFKLKIMVSVKGIGDKTSYTLLGAMPELGRLTRREAASLAGLAPHPHDSGSLHGYRHTGGGRSCVRKALFMAALSASQHHEELSKFYQRLLKNGKKRMVALVAVMRKLIAIINGKLRDAMVQRAAV